MGYGNAGKTRKCRQTGRGKINESERTHRKSKSCRFPFYRYLNWQLLARQLLAVETINSLFACPWFQVAQLLRVGDASFLRLLRWEFFWPLKEHRGAIDNRSSALLGICLSLGNRLYFSWPLLVFVQAYQIKKNEAKYKLKWSHEVYHTTKPPRLPSAAVSWSFSFITFVGHQSLDHRTTSQVYYAGTPDILRTPQIGDKAIGRCSSDARRLCLFVFWSVCSSISTSV